MGIFDTIGDAVFLGSLAVENAVLEIKNKKIDKKIKELEKRSQTKKTGRFDKEEANSQFDLFFEIFSQIARHKDFGARNPIDIGLELGYSEKDILDLFEYLEAEENAETGK